MDKRLFKQTNEKLKFQLTDKKSYSKIIRKGGLIATIIAATPFVFYLYEYVPDSPTWNTPLFTYTSVWYESAQVAAWVVMSKVIPLLLALVWFFTCKHWWYHALLVPIAMFIFQIFSAINDDVNIDFLDLVYIVPVMALIFPSIYLVRAKMFNKLNEADKTMEELEEEFMIKPKDFMGKLKQYF